MSSSSKRKLSGIEKVFILSLIGNVRNCSSSTVWFQIMLIRNKHHFCCILKLEFSCIEFSKIRKRSFLANTPVKVIYNVSTVTQVTTRLELDITVHSKLTAHEMNMALRWPALDFQPHVICPSFLPRACTPVKLKSRKKDISTKCLYETVALFDKKVRFHIVWLFLKKT